MFKEITLTKDKALEIQRKHVEHYKHLRADLPEVVAAATTADQLLDGVEYPVQIINKHIPRGGVIEAMCGVDFGGN